MYEEAYKVLFTLKQQAEFDPIAYHNNLTKQEHQV